MASTVATVLTAIRDALRASHTHYDLSTVSGTPRVDIGELIEAPISDNHVAIWFSANQASYRTLSTYAFVTTFLWRAYLAQSQGDDDSPSDRTLIATNLGSDIVEALQDAHNDAGNAALHALERLLVTVDAVEGASDASIPGAIVVNGSIEVEYSQARGL